MGLGSLVILQKLWKGFNRVSKLRTIRACVFPTATYGCETWTLNSETKKKISAFELKCYWKMFRIIWTEKWTNKSIIRELNIEEGWLLNFVIRQKLKYFGHITRHDCLEKQILEGKITGKRKGRPHRRWVEDITDILKMSTTDIAELAEDRIKYRALIKDATSPKDMQWQRGTE